VFKCINPTCDLCWSADVQFSTSAGGTLVYMCMRSLSSMEQDVARLQQDEVDESECRICRAPGEPGNELFFPCKCRCVHMLCHMPAVYVPSPGCRNDQCLLIAFSTADTAWLLTVMNLLLAIACQARPVRMMHIALTAAHEGHLTFPMLLAAAPSSMCTSNV